MSAGEQVWRALADPSRRRLLGLLRDGPRTTGALAAEFDTTRFAVMKHLTVLQEAGLVLAERRGRERWNHLNPVPLRAALGDFLTPYADRWATASLRLKAAAEPPGGTMTTDLAAPPLDVRTEVRVEAPRERVFAALLDAGAWWPHRFRAGSAVHLEPHVGGRYWEDFGDGDGALYGVVARLERPARLTIHGSMGLAGPVVSVVAYELAADGDATVVTTTHRAYGDVDEETRAGYTEGWAEVLAVLKAYAEGR